MDEILVVGPDCPPAVTGTLNLHVSLNSVSHPIFRTIHTLAFLLFFLETVAPPRTFSDDGLPASSLVGSVRAKKLSDAGVHVFLLNRALPT